MLWSFVVQIPKQFSIDAMDLHESTCHSFSFLTWAFLVLALLTHSASAAAETTIYIDKIPLYKDLAPCAQDRVSAIVRAQSSGCGDDMQLTSFSCFCVDSSSAFSSIISTAVQNRCAAPQTGILTATGPQTTGAAAANVSSALEVFHSYCEKTTDLRSFANTGTPTVIITPPPQTVTVAPATANNDKKTPVAAIAVPVVVVPVLIAAAAFLLFIRRRPSRSNTAELETQHVAPEQHHLRLGPTPHELGDDGKAQEMSGLGNETYELRGAGLERAELQGSEVAGVNSEKRG